jgi:hypothetical protein
MNPFTSALQQAKNMAGKLAGTVSSAANAVMGRQLISPVVQPGAKLPRQEEQWRLDENGNTVPRFGYKGVDTNITGNEPQLGAFGPDMKIFNPNVSTESAAPVIRRILESYKPKDAPQGWKSPLLGYVEKMATIAGKYKIDPRLLAYIPLAESGGLKPGSISLLRNNAYNAMGENGPHQYANVGQSIENYGAGIAGPVAANPAQRVPGVNRWTGMAKLGPQNTLRQFVQMHNPEDNPDQQLQLLLQLAQQYQ